MTTFFGHKTIPVDHGVVNKSHNPLAMYEEKLTLRQLIKYKDLKTVGVTCTAQELHVKFLGMRIFLWADT